MKIANMRVLICLLLLLPFYLVAQDEQATTEKTEVVEEKKPETLKEHEAHLIALFESIVDQPFDVYRKERNKDFIPAMVEALKTPGSFHFPFSKLESISSIYAPDSAFRIMSWALPEGNKQSGIDDLPSDRLKEDLTYRYFGAIQMNSPELKLHPLTDFSLFFSNPEDTLLDNRSWYGCIYYNMVMKEHNGRKYYNLFGWDGNDSRSNSKIMDVLHFENDVPMFGAPIFEVFRDDSLMLKKRFILEYKADAGVGLNYNKELDAVIFDYIKPQTPESKGAYGTYIPDGTYDGLQFKDGIWKFVPSIYDALGISTDLEFENPLFGPSADKLNQGKKKRKKVK